ncbi:unnamed protein product, partial [Didymodactylos carnosus]
MAEIRLKMSEEATKQKQLDLELECVKRQKVEHISTTTTNRLLSSLSLSSSQPVDDVTYLAYYSNFLNNRMKVLDISSFENQSINIKKFENIINGYLREALKPEKKEQDI